MPIVSVLSLSSEKTLAIVSDISFSYQRQQLDQSLFSLLFSSVASPSHLCMMHPGVSETMLILSTEKETRSIDFYRGFGGGLGYFCFIFLPLRSIPFSCILPMVPPNSGLILGSETAFSQGFWQTDKFCLEASGFSSGCQHLARLPTYAQFSASLLLSLIFFLASFLKLSNEEPLICS